ncbi:GNAT superfamily N-acetyltransferase [Pseudarthrobacter oxydans]|uniref:GNAT family N-acetyltransferase n=1 Tax=Pseudarthrobacter oxydans TaxID=1671 RepID=UPI00277D9AFF|nr:GNAT family N-acetyltransferase [Pseudarthrobacter oxydans]MDP9984511.1 GNAT superfamily N-acetyltransferase [Pseudarthrobacter oxydans]
MTAAPYRIERLVIPDALDSPDAGDFLEFSTLSDALVLEVWGNLDRATPPGARLRYWRDDAYKRMQLFFVRTGGRMVARSWLRYGLQDNVGSALLHVDVLNDFTGRGIGRALLAHAEALAVADGRTVLMTFTEHPADFDAEGPDVLRPATGTGALPAAARGVRFAQRAGYRLEQVERFSSLDLPPAPGLLDALEREALARAEPYELVTWTDRCPEEYVEQLAVLMSRMSTDAPTGGLSYDEETWDAARVRHVEDTWKQAGNVSLVTAARHRDSNELAAYSVLELAPGKPWLADQDDTLVAAGHRGHRLGMLVKIRNLRRLLAGYPAVERVTTFNAAENDHMLAINVALGFRPAGYDGEWQRTADAAGRGS